MTAQALVVVALERLIDERKLLTQDRASRASDAALDWAIDRVSDAKRHVAAEEWAAASTALKEVSRRAIDSWSLNAEVTDVLAQCSQELRRMAGDA